eukprot:PhM_4_TR18618/c0_g1_i3/m.83867
MPGPGPGSTVVVRSAERVEVPMVRIVSRDAMGNDVGPLDTERRLFVATMGGVHVGSGGSHDGVVTMLIVLTAPKIGNSTVSIKLLTAAVPSVEFDFQLRIIKGVADAVRTFLSESEVAKWRFGSERTTFLYPMPVMYVVDAGENPLSLSDGAPMSLTLMYDRITVGAAGQIHTIKQTYTTTINRDVYTFYGLRTQGLFGHTYTISVYPTNGTSASALIKAYVRRGISVQPCATINQRGIISTTQCVTCPESIICDGTERVEVRSNYWRPSSSSFTMYSCSPPYSADSCYNGTCLEGYQGVRCSTCTEGYGKTGLQCVKCGIRLFNILQLVGIGLLILVVIVVLIVGSISSGGAADDLLPILIKMLTTHLQISSQVGEFASAIPGMISTVFAIQRSITSMPTQLPALDCELGLSYHTRFVLIMLAPIALLLLLVLAIIAWRIFVKMHGDGAGTAKDPYANLTSIEHAPTEVEDAARRHQLLCFPGGRETRTLKGRALLRDMVRVHIWSSPVKAKEGNFLDVAHYVMRKGYGNVLDENKGVKYSILSAIIVLFFLYPTLIEQCAYMLRCEDIEYGNGVVVSVLEADRSVDCNSSQHVLFSNIAIALGFFYSLGVPFFTVLTIIAVARVLKDFDVATNVFYFMTAGFRQRCWYWECIILLRKAILIFIVIFIQNERLQTYLGMWLMSFMIMLNVVVRPYRNDLLKKVETLSLAVITITLNMGLLFSYLSQSDVLYWVLALFLVALNSMILIMFLVFISQAVMIQLRYFADSNKQDLLPFLRQHRTLAAFLHVEVDDVLLVDVDIDDGEYDDEADRERQLRERRRAALAAQKERAKGWGIEFMGFAVNNEDDDDKDRHVDGEEDAVEEAAQGIRRMQARIGLLHHDDGPKDVLASTLSHRDELQRRIDGLKCDVDGERRAVARAKSIADIAAGRLVALREKRASLELQWQRMSTAKRTQRAMGKALRDRGGVYTPVLAVPSGETVDVLVKDWTEERMQLERDRINAHVNRRRRRPPNVESKDSAGGQATPSSTLSPTDNDNSKMSVLLQSFAYLMQPPEAARSTAASSRQGEESRRTTATNRQDQTPLASARTSARTGSRQPAASSTRGTSAIMPLAQPSTSSSNRVAK